MTPTEPHADAPAPSLPPEAGRPDTASLNGNCVAMLRDLPHGTKFERFGMPGREHCRDESWDRDYDRPVIVTRWADGTTPAPSAAPVAGEADERLDVTALPEWRALVRAEADLSADTTWDKDGLTIGVAAAAGALIDQVRRLTAAAPSAPTPEPVDHQWPIYGDQGPLPLPVAWLLDLDKTRTELMAMTDAPFPRWAARELMARLDAAPSPTDGERGELWCFAHHCWETGGRCASKPVPTVPARPAPAVEGEQPARPVCDSWVHPNTPSRSANRYCATCGWSKGKHPAPSPGVLEDGADT